MSLKDLLPPGTYDEIEKEANQGHSSDTSHETSNGDGAQVIKVSCPTCKKKIKYSTDNPFRPFCSERCKLLDLGAWADEKHAVPGKEVNEDEDADLLSDPNLPVRNLPGQNL